MKSGSLLWSRSCEVLGGGWLGGGVSVVELDCWMVLGVVVFFECKAYDMNGGAVLQC